MQFFISAITQKIHTTRECSVTRRNHAVNLRCDRDAEYLANNGYVGCKRCDAHRLLTAAKSS